MEQRESSEVVEAESASPAVDPPEPAGDAVAGGTRYRLSGLYARGLAMGTADVIPGVSGGTIALIVGIYPAFVEAIGSLNVRWLRPLLASLVSRGPAASAQRALAWQHVRAVHWRFLTALGAGMLTAMIVGSRVIPQLLETHRTETYAFFFGLILASIPIPVRMMPHRRAREALIALAFAAATFHLVGLPELRTIDAAWFLLPAGAAAICAMVLPGVSGSYLLLMLGQYERVLLAVRELRVVELGLFAAGVAMGLIAFSRLLRWLLHHHASPTLAALVGVLAGALRSVWPFQQPIDPAAARPAYQPVWPDAIDGELWSALLAFAAGVTLLVALERLGRTRRSAPR